MENLKLSTVSNGQDCLKGKVVLITGASEGIGRVLALETAKAGASTILLGKSLKKLESVYDEITEKGYPEPALHPINFLNAQDEEIYSLVAHVQNMFGKLNALVHNASTYAQLTPVEHLSPSKWQEVIRINLSIPYLLTHAFLPLLAESAPANILFTTADEAYRGKAYWSAYSASKFGLLGFAESLFEEWENDGRIRINCINPKAVQTPSRLKAYPAIDPNSLRKPESIMDYYIYLLSDSSKAINGRLIEV